MSHGEGNDRGKKAKTKKKKSHQDSKIKKRPGSLNKHHLVPSSRGGTNKPDNIKTVNKITHVYWHKLFLNWRPDEIIKMLENCGREIFIRDSRDLKDAWRKLFDDKTDEEIIEIIRQGWS